MRQSRVTIAVNGLSYYTNTIYDAETGKVGQVRNFSGFTLDYGYTRRGYLSTITDDATGLAYFTANARDASLQLTQSTAGNGVVSHADYDALTGRIVDIYAGPNQSIAHLSYDFDAVGNLTARGDVLHSLTESFAYDPLNRLTSTVLNGQTRTIRYNSAGSITEKSDVCAVNNCFAYSATQVHALSSITGGTVNGVANPNFTYDADGNMTSGAGRTASYTSFNMVEQAIEGTTTLNLLYDPEHGRIQQTAPEGTTYYLNDPASGAMTERVFPTTGSSVWRNYILADGKIVAERSVKGTNVTLRYFVLDHLGSTVALTNETGALVETDAYDPWGKARDASTGADDTTCSKPGQAFSTRGYTGHEEMPDLCLVNMNARIYDPVIGRFMSPDDVISDAYNGQSYNRYTYVDDNPLSYTDPTGHDINMGWGFIPHANERVDAPIPSGGIVPGPSMSPDPYWPHIEVSHMGPSTLGARGAHAMSSGLVADSKSPSGLTTPAVSVSDDSIDEKFAAMAASGSSTPEGQIGSDFAPDDAKVRMVTSQKERDYLLARETFSAFIYNDNPKHPERGTDTIGYGHTGSDVATIAAAYPNGLSTYIGGFIFDGDLDVAEQAVRNNLKVKVSQNQFDALVDFAFNAGAGALARSTILAGVNAGNLEDAANEFPKTRITQGGVVVQGLITRREEEKAIFNDADYTVH